MERIIVPKGTKQNFETLFEDLQDYTATNLKRNLDRFVGSYGIQATVSNGTVTSDEFKVQHATPTTLTVEPGTAITTSFNFLRSLSQTTINMGTLASGYYSILANAAPYTDTPTAVVNGFLFDSSGGTTTNTRYHESVSFEVTASGTAATTSGIYLANIDWDGVSACTVYDRRVENIFLFRDSAINDSNIVKKDRNSTISGDLNLVGELVLQYSDASDSFTWKDETGSTLGSLTKTKNYLTQNTGFGGETAPEHPVDVDGVTASTEMRSDKFTNDTDGNDVLIQPRSASGNIITKLFDDNGQGQFQDKDGTVVCYFDKDSFNFNKPVNYLDLVTVTSLTVTDSVTLPGFPTMSGVTNSEFLIGYGTLNGGAGLRVLTEDPDPTNITNFKIYDNKPTSNPSEKMSYVHLTWNYKDVNGIYVSDNIFEVTGLIEAGGNIDNTEANLVSKYLYFPESGNKYQILSWNNTTKQMTLGDNYDDNMEEPNIPNFPARIIDGAGTGYQVKITSNKDASASIDFKESDTRILDLDSTFIYNPELSLKLALGETHWIQIRCVNNLTRGSFVILPSGTYDPDHVPGGQPDQEYAQPFVNTLPLLDDDGSITLDATLFGFNVDIGGWYDATDTDKSAHEFEVGWTTLSSLDWSSTTNTTTMRTTNRHVPVSTNTSATWQVGVRPYQNRQLVGLTKTAQVLAGGGGVPPNMSLMAEAIADVTVISGMFASISTVEVGGAAAIEAYQFDDITYYDSITLATNQLATTGNPKKLIPDGLTWDTGDGSGVIYANNSTDATANKFVQSLGSGISTGLTNTLFYIGTSKTGRKIYQSDLNSDMRVKKIVFDCDIATGVSPSNPGVIRVYQYGDEANAGTLDVTGINAVFTQDLDVEILAATDASRRVIIDAWDPDTGSPNNTCQLRGTIRLYGENVVATRSDGSSQQSQSAS